MVVAALSDRGVDAGALVQRVGMDPAAFDEPDARYPILATTDLWKMAVEATGDPCFGLWVSRFTTQTSFHALGYSIMASTTLAEVFDRVARYSKVVSDAATIEIELQPALRLWLDPVADRPAPSHESIDAVLSAMARTVRTLCPDAAQPSRVELQRPEPDPSAPFEKVFRTAVRFSAPRNLLEYPADLADRRLPGGHAELARRNDEVVLDYLSRIDGDLASTRLRTWLLGRLPNGEPSEDMAAKALGVSLRSLQRQLREENTTYKVVLNALRQELACAYLADQRYSVTEITFLLGFANTSGFSRAFRRWTGTSPSAYRAR